MSNDDFEFLNCPYDGCTYITDGMTSLSIHFRKKHKKTSKDLYIKLYCAGKEPRCKCGCKSEVKFLDITRGFRDYVRGHASKINNNFQTEKAVKNSLLTRRKMLRDGSWKPFALKETGEIWNKGLTKDTDERVAKMSASISENKEELKAKSERMRKGRIDGTIPTLYGKEHSQWKGGISPLANCCHSNKSLFDEWKYPKLKEAKFSCQECGDNYYKNPSVGLEVHHDKEKMASIIRLIAEKHDWEDYVTVSHNPDLQSVKNKIVEEVAEYHIKNNVSGIVLCKKCHKNIHEKYNLK